MPQPPRITVLGSLNMDISVTVSRLAGPGETVLGSAARLQPGGKGANQAVAAARLGASVRMAGCCGDDAFGGALRSEWTKIRSVRSTWCPAPPSAAGSSSTTGGTDNRAGSTGPGGRIALGR